MAITGWWLDFANRASLDMACASHLRRGCTPEFCQSGTFVARYGGQ